MILQAWSIGSHLYPVGIALSTVKVDRLCDGPPASLGVQYGVGSRACSWRPPSKVSAWSAAFLPIAPVVESLQEERRRLIVMRVPHTTRWNRSGVILHDVGFAVCR
jgi:hypothetical protein